MTLDELRVSRPTLGFAVYAYTPGGAVTLEVHDKGEIYSFVGATEAEAIARAFPPAVSQTPSGVGSAPALRPTLDPTGAGGVAETPGGVFD